MARVKYLSDCFQYSIQYSSTSSYSAALHESMTIPEATGQCDPGITDGSRAGLGLVAAAGSDAHREQLAREQRARDHPPGRGPGCLRGHVAGGLLRGCSCIGYCPVLLGCCSLPQGLRKWLGHSWTAMDSWLPTPFRLRLVYGGKVDISTDNVRCARGSCAPPSDCPPTLIHSTPSAVATTLQPPSSNPSDWTHRAISLW